MSAAPTARLVVALPPEEAALALLDSALAMAERLERELVGLFLEDRALLAAAALPFTRIVPRHALAEAAFDVATTERAVRVLAERARHRLAGSAAAARVRWRFEVARGGLETLGLAPGDVLALGLGGTLPATAEPVRLPCPVVVMGRRGGPVVAVHEGDAELLRLARRLASEGGVPLVVLAAEPAVEEVARVLAGATAAVEPCRLDDEQRLAAAIRARRPGLVVIDSCGGGTAWRAAVAAVRPGSAGGAEG